MSKNKRYTDEEFINAIKSSYSIREALIKLGLKGSGGNYKLAKRRTILLGIDTSHLTGQGHLRGKTHNWAKKIPLSEILVENLIQHSFCSSKLKQRLFKEGRLENKCYKCGLTNWLGQSLSLELEHINGNSFDNRIENLIILCPNCHAQTPTYRRKKSSFDEKKIYFCSNCNKEISKGSESGLCINCVRMIRFSKDNCNHFCENCKTPITKKAKFCVKCMILNNRKVKDRPSKEQLLKEIEETNYCVVARKYGVSDNAIRKWLKV